MENHPQELAQAATPESPSVLTIRDLKKNMEIHGTVKRVSEVGVFIDAGLDGEGFLHASEYRPLGKDKGIEFHVGDPITVWVKAVAPDLKSFRATLKEPLKYRMSDLKPGMVVTGKVVRITNFGAFVNIGAKTDGLVHVSEMSDQFVRNPADVVSVGDEVQVKILKVEGNKISLSMKALIEKEPEPVEEEEATPEEEEAVPTVMELALQQARERAKQEKRARAKSKESRGPSPVDDIIARTLQYHREQSKK
ncbi:MAG: S1 RNA-binding domain-containing protein [Anaerolineae bacterium]